MEKEFVGWRSEAIEAENMNASQFMDKQILDLMNPQAQPQEEASTRHVNGDSPANKEEILASYDFQPIRTVGSSPPASTWGSLDSRLASSNLKVILLPSPSPFSGGVELGGIVLFLWPWPLGPCSNQSVRNSSVALLN